MVILLFFKYQSIPYNEPIRIDDKKISNVVVREQIRFQQNHSDLDHNDEKIVPTNYANDDFRKDSTLIVWMAVKTTLFVEIVMERNF